mgnify:FL=1|jgi:hypothetical protein
MTTYNKTKSQKIIYLNNNVNTEHKINNLNNRINDQEQKLNKIIELLQNGNNLPNANKQSS